MSMKFKTQKQLNNLCRLGLITDIEGFNKNIETPTTFCFLKEGTFPFLTPDIVQQIKHLPELIQCPLNYLADKLDVLERFDKDLSSFIGRKNLPIIITQGDQSQLDVEGSITKNTISAWCTGGRRQITLKDYFRIIKSCKPFMWQSPCDNEAPVNNTAEKRLQKAVERTISFNNSTLKEIQDQTLPGICLTSFTGGNNWLRRRQCLERMLTPNMKGVIMDGFHGIANETGDKINEAIDLIGKVNERIRKFDESVIVMLPKLNQPYQVVQAVKNGIDLFDGSFPYSLTSAKIAWVYTSFEKRSTDNDEVKANNQWLELSDNTYEDSFDLPISSDCECFACVNHTRGYINHLIKTKELLADILLMIHNSTQYYQFFYELRQSMKEGNFDSFHDWAIDIQCPLNLLEDVKL